MNIQIHAQVVEGVDGRMREYQTTTVRRYSNHIIRFNKMFGKHSINALAAYEFNDYWAKATDMYGIGFIPGFEVLDVVAKPEKVGGSISQYSLFYLMQTMLLIINIWHNYLSVAMEPLISEIMQNMEISFLLVPDGTLIVKNGFMPLGLIY